MPRLLVAMMTVLLLLTQTADAQPRRGHSNASNSHSSYTYDRNSHGRHSHAYERECASLRYATPGLRGLCESYCKRHDQSHVNLNDIASVRAAAPSVRLLERYNAIRRRNDPAMPCFADGDEPGDTDLPDNLPDDLPDEPPVVTACACWTSEQVQVIDGLLDVVRGKTSSAHCTINDSDLGVYEAQIYEGYDLGTANEIKVNSAFAYFDLSDSSVQGCMLESPSDGILNFTLEHRAEARYCLQTIVDQCATIN